MNEVLAVAIGVGLGFCCLAFIGAPLLIALDGSAAAHNVIRLPI